MKKRIVSFLALFTLLLTLLPVSVTAAEIESGVCAEGITWSFDTSGTLTVSGTGAIPDYANGTQPWKAYQNSSTNYIKTVVVGEGIKRIGDRAFQNCKKMTAATVPPSVTEIGKWAFQNCYKLTSLALSPDVKLDTGAFRSAPAEDDILAYQTTTYMDSRYHKALSNVALTGDYRTDVINIALSQLGYHEGDSELDFDGENTSSSNNYTEFGRFVGSAGSDWCSEFAHWCIRMAGVPTSIVNISRTANAANFTKNTAGKYYTWAETVCGGGSYTPQPGDLCLWAWNLDDHTADEALSHTSLFNGLTDNGDGTVTIHSIDGNLGGKVRTKDYVLDKAKGTRTGSDEGQLYYIVSPNYAQSVTTHRVSFESEGMSFADKTVAAKGRYGALPLPERTGYNFLGWYTAETGGTLVNMYTPVSLSADQTLYARWEEKTLSGALNSLTWKYGCASGTLHFGGTLSEEETLYVAKYTESGRLLGVDLTAKSGDTLQLGSACKAVKLFLVGENGTPICEHVTVER